MSLPSTLCSLISNACQCCSCWCGGTSSSVITLRFLQPLRACILLPDMVHISQNAILQKKRRTVIMRKPCDLWAEPAQRLQAQKIICSRHGASVLADDKDLQPMGGARIHSSAEELVFKRHGPPVPADNRGYIIMFYIYSTLLRCLKTSTSTNNHKEYERLHGPHSQCGEF